MTLDIVLTACKVPHEIAPIHEAHLVAMEEFEVLCSGGFMVSTTFTCPVLVELRMTAGVVVAPHAGEYTSVILTVDEFLLMGSGDVTVTSLLILSTHIFGVAFLGINRFASGVVLTGEERGVAILLTSQICTHGYGILGGVLVEGSVCVGTNHQKEECRIANDKHQESEDGGVDNRSVLLLGRGIPKAPYNQSREQQEEDYRTCVERQMQCIDKEDVESGIDIHYAGDDAPQNQRKQHHGDYTTPDETLDSGLGPLTEVDHINDGRNRKEVQQVDTDSDADQEADQYQPTQRARIVSLFLPLKDSPEHDGSEE